MQVVVVVAVAVVVVVTRSEHHLRADALIGQLRRQERRGLDLLLEAAGERVVVIEMIETGPRHR